MRARRFLLPAAVLTVTIGIGLAQLELPGPSAPPLADDDVSSLITGEFSGNTHMDAVVLANGKPVLRESVETYETYVQANVTATDIANLRGTGAYGRDQVVAVGSGGLHLLEIQGSGLWSSTTLRGTGTYWASAIAVRTGQVDGANGDDIVAVTSSRVVIARSNGNGGWETPDVTFLAGTNVTGVELVDWDGGSELELAVLIGTNSGGAARIRITKLNLTPPAHGDLLETIYSTGDVIVASPLAESENGPRWLAAVSTIASTGAQDLVVLGDTSLGGPWSLGVAGVKDSVAADWNGDGIDDLILGTNTSRDAWLFPMTFAGTMQLTIDELHAPPQSPVTLPVGHPNRNVSVQDGRMDVADVDHDGDIDLVTAVQGQYQNTTWFYKDSRFSTVDATLNSDNNQFEWMPWHTPGSPWPDGFPVPDLNIESGDLTVPLLTPEVVIDGAQFEYAVWRTPTIEALAIATPFFVPSGPVQIGSLEVNGYSYSKLTIPLGQHDPFFADRYTLILRQVVRDGSAIVSESPALKVTFFSSLHSDEFSIDWNINSNDVLAISEPPDNDGGTAAGAGVPPTPLNQNP